MAQNGSTSGTDVTLSPGDGRPSPDEPPQTDLDGRRQETGDIRALVQALMRAFSSLLSYPSNSRVLVKQKEALAALFDRHLSTHDDLRLTLSEEGFHAEGVSLPSHQRRAVTLPFLLFTGGLREIIFHVGIDAEELWSFLDAVRTCATLPEDDRDVESLLWEREFANIEYVAVEELETEGAGEIEGWFRELELPTLAAKENVPLTHLDASELVSFKARLVQSGGVGRDALDVEPAEGISEFMVWNDRDLEQIEQITDRTQLQSTPQQAVDLLSDILELEEVEERWTDIIHLIDGYYRELIQRRDFPSAVQLIGRLRKMAAGQEAAAARAQTALERLLAPAGRETIRETLAQGFVPDIAALEQFLRTIGPEVIPQLCAALSMSADNKTRESLAEMVLKLADGNANLIIPVAKESPPQVILEIVPLLGRIPTADALRGLGLLARHSDSRVRLAAVAELVKRAEPDAARHLVRCLSDENLEVRLRALSRLSMLNDEGALWQVVGMVEHASFYRRNRLEQMALIEALDRWKWEGAVGVLTQLLLRRRGLGGQDYEPVRWKAAMALRSIGTEPARNVLDRGARSWRKSVRRACRRALQET